MQRRHANSVSPWCGVRSSFVRTASFVGLYSATGGAEFGPPPLGGPCGLPRTLCHAPAPLTRPWSSIFVGYNSAVGGSKWEKLF